MSQKQWAVVTTAATSASTIAFAHRAGSQLTEDINLSWMPFQWISFRSKTASATNIRLYIRGCPEWEDPNEAFLNDYGEQYVLAQASLDIGRVNFVGEVWGFSIVSAPTSGLVIQGGTGPCPYS